MLADRRPGAAADHENVGSHSRKDAARSILGGGVERQDVNSRRLARQAPQLVFAAGDRQDAPAFCARSERDLPPHATARA
jgi:hypothetical protein